MKNKQTVVSPLAWSTSTASVTVCDMPSILPTVIMAITDMDYYEKY